MDHTVESRFSSLGPSLSDSEWVDIGQGMTPKMSDSWLRKGIIARGGCKGASYAGRVVPGVAEVGHSDQREDRLWMAEYLERKADELETLATKDQT